MGFGRQHKHRPAEREACPERAGETAQTDVDSNFALAGIETGKTAVASVCGLLYCREWEHGDSCRVIGSLPCSLGNQH